MADIKTAQDEAHKKSVALAGYIAGHALVHEEGRESPGSRNARIAEHIRETERLLNPGAGATRTEIQYGERYG